MPWPQVINYLHSRVLGDALSVDPLRAGENVRVDPDGFLAKPLGAAARASPDLTTTYEFVANLLVIQRSRICARPVDL